MSENEMKVEDRKRLTFFQVTLSVRREAHPEAHPCEQTTIIVKASSEREAVQKAREKYPSHRVLTVEPSQTFFIAG